MLKKMRDLLIFLVCTGSGLGTSSQVHGFYSFSNAGSSPGRSLWNKSKTQASDKISSSYNTNKNIPDSTDAETVISPGENTTSAKKDANKPSNKIRSGGFVDVSIGKAIESTVYYKTNLGRSTQPYLLDNKWNHAKEYPYISALHGGWLCRFPYSNWVLGSKIGFGIGHNVIGKSQWETSAKTSPGKAVFQKSFHLDAGLQAGLCCGSTLWYALLGWSGYWLSADMFVDHEQQLLYHIRPQFKNCLFTGGGIRWHLSDSFAISLFTQIYLSNASETKQYTSHLISFDGLTTWKTQLIEYGVQVGYMIAAHTS